MTISNEQNQDFFLFQLLVYNFNCTTGFTAVKVRWLLRILDFFLPHWCVSASYLKKTKANVYFLLFLFYNVKLEQSYCGSKLVSAKVLHLSL